MDRPLVTHAHSQCHVLLKASGADTFFQVRDKLYPLTGESAVLINTWEPHCYAHRDQEGPRTTILALYIEPLWLGEIENGLISSGHPGFFPKTCVELPRPIRKLANRLAMEMMYGEHLTDAYLQSRLSNLMIAVIDAFSEWRTINSLQQGIPANAHDHRIRRAVGYMRANIGAELDIDKLAVEACLSRAHFFKLFQQCTSLTPNLYLNVLRMNSAFSGLTQSTLPMAALSERLGFSAQSHFTRFFQQHAGVNPSQYRKVVDVHQIDAASVNGEP
ncbi:MAG: AraC family transcriptional regulator [Herminiimonas sp.]|nr:AraC family transcriptional regulator [Herminiimonas sp.]